MKKKITNFLNLLVSKKKHVILIYSALAIIASLQSFYAPPAPKDEAGLAQTKYNNYVIFKQSFYHLLNGADLYVLYPAEHWDFFKYTPTFAMLFGAFAVLPDALGLSLWNLLNALVLVLAVYYLPVFGAKQKGIVLAVCLLEMLTSIQNEQANGLMAGLLVFAFGLLERKQYAAAMLCIALSIYVKLFGAVGMALCLFYPRKPRLAMYFVGWSVALFVLPLLLISVDQYANLLQSYSYLLASDHDASLGYSVMGWLHSWFGLNVNKNAVVGAFGLLLLLPLVKVKSHKDCGFRLLFLASLLIWAVIFNHKAESPTFIIAMSGVALWFAAARQAKAARLAAVRYADMALFVLAFVFVSLSPTDVFPRTIRELYVHPLCLKAVPCIFIWFKILYEMLSFKSGYLLQQSPRN